MKPVVPAHSVRGGTPALTALLSSAMIAGTFALFALGVLASFIIDELDITRGQLGLIIATDSILAAFMAPWMGRLVDRFGGKRSLVMVLLMASSAWWVYAIAPFYAVLFVGAVVSGLANSSSNPSTNRLIAETLPMGGRGVVMGIKQSGVQLGGFLGGLALPSIAVAMGWRAALAIAAIVPLAAAAMAWRLVETPLPSGRDHTAQTPSRLPVAIRWLAAYGFLFGFAGAAALLVPLYVEEALGQDARAGGFVAAAVAFTSIGARIWWARLSERLGRYVELLGAMAPLGVLGGLAFLAASSVSWLVWPAGVLVGFSVVSWNSVGMLAAINEGGTAASGKASGAVVLGFLLGLGIGPPVYGTLVDRTGSYVPMWCLFIASSMAAGLLVIVWRSRMRPVESR